MRKKVLICMFFLFSMTLFCAEELTAERAGWGRHKERRDQLVENIKRQYSDVNNGVIILLSNFETDTGEFKQESHFYYLTGVKEPGTILLLDLSGESVLYIPGDLEKRAVWTSVQRELLQKNAEELGVSEIVELGSDATGPFFLEDHYSDLCKRLREVTQKGGTTFTLRYLANTPTYCEQTLALGQLNKFVPDLDEHIENISSILFSMRQVKDKQEIECLRRAIAITVKAQIAGAQQIRPGKTEREVRGAVDGTILTQSRPGFCSIIGSGINTTILHHPASDKIMNSGELVIVDIGAECGCDSYSGDLTRTYPVSGKFSDEQRDIYSIVFGALQRVVENARPGCYFVNKEDESRSLTHIASKFFERHGYDKYFTHGIGHHIGLDVHEDCVENQSTFRNKLQVGNVIALEPGLYFPEKCLGVRIESDYLITEGGAVCLDKELPKDPDGIEALMRALPEEE